MKGTVRTTDNVRVADSSRLLSGRFGSPRTRLLVLVAFSLCSLLMTWPLIRNVRTAVPGPPWDNMVWLYDLWWFRHSILDLHQWPSYNPGIFYPYGYDLTLSETMLANKALIAPFLFLGDEVLAYNALLLTSFVLTGYAAYLYVAYLTDNRGAAMVAAAVFTFASYRMHVMAAGWLPLISTQWIPLAFLYLERTLHEGKARFALATGCFVALSALCSWYYLYIVGVGLVLYLLVRLHPWRAGLKTVHLGRNLLLAGGSVALLVAPVALPVVFGRSGAMGWPLGEVEKWALSIEDFFLPNVYHPVWGEAFLSLRSYTQRYPWYAPGCVYLGIVALLLAGYAVVRGEARNPIGRALLWSGAISMVLALGVVLRFNNRVVGIPAPTQVEAVVTRGLSALMSKWALHKAPYSVIRSGPGTIPVPLPGLLVYLFMPLGNAMRTLFRFGAITTLSVAVLAGMGAARLHGGVRFPDAAGAGELPMLPSLSPETLVMPGAGSSGTSPGKPWWARLLGRVAWPPVLLFCLVIADFVSAPLPYGYTRVAPQPLDLWLAARSDKPVVAQFPLVRALSGAMLYAARYHGQRIAYGQGTFYPTEYEQAKAILERFPSSESLALLKRWGVIIVVVGSKAYDAGWGDQRGQSWASVRQQIEQPADQASPGLRFVGMIQDTPMWFDERVSRTIRGSLPVEPILVDTLYVYEVQ